MTTSVHWALVLGGSLALLGAAGCRFDGSGMIGGRDGGRDVVRLDITGLDLWADQPVTDGEPASDLPVDAPNLIDLSADTIDPCPSCELGCNVAEQRCHRILPSNVDQTLLSQLWPGADGACKPTAPKQLTVDGDTGAFGDCRAAGQEGVSVGGIVWQRITMSNGVQAALFLLDVLEVGPNTTLHGEGSLALIIVARETIHVRGAIDVSAKIATPGPGGRRGGKDNGADGVLCHADSHGKGGKTTSTFDDGGGGGGGWATAGGVGGSGDNAAGGLGGTVTALGSNHPLTPLRGGCGGGAGGGGDGGAGGGGGGALQLSAGQALIIEGQLLASGGGGDGGHTGNAGGGGGSGGSILLEAPLLTVHGIVAANGGGGGAGANSATEKNAADGRNGQPTTTRAAGGTSSGNVGGDGAAGGALAGLPGNGGNGSYNGGGGGGAVGVVRLHSQQSAVVTGLLSPAPTPDVGTLTGW